MINLFDITNKDFHPFVQDWFLTGSTVICNPTPTGTDIDICVLVQSSDAVNPIYYLNHTHGGIFIDNTVDNWEYCAGIQYSSSKYTALRKDEYNLILMRDANFFKRWRLATKVCKVVNPLYKPYRIQIFESIIYPPEELLKVEGLIDDS
jgi:hypothetical protein